MDIKEIAEFIRDMDAVLVLEPSPGDGSPEIAWGDLFFYYAPDGVIPKTQPFATIVTKDYPGDETSRLNRPGAFRVNIAAGATEFNARAGNEPGDDIVSPHPVYSSQKWLAVTNPGDKSATEVKNLLRIAHRRAKDRRSR